MSEKPLPPLRPGVRANLAREMLRKFSDMKEVYEKTGKPTGSLQQEAERQLRQVIRDNTITKSGPED